MTDLQHSHYIDGRWVRAHGTGSIEVESPIDGRIVGSVARGDEHDVDRAVAAARRAFAGWAATPLGERLARIDALATLLGEHCEQLAQTLTKEMGSPITFARRAQVPVAIADLRALVEAARAHRNSETVSNSLVVSEPVGVVAAITPWNFPLHQIVLKVGAALLAGCTVVLKPSEVAPLNAVDFGELVDGLGLPPGVLNIVFGSGAEVGERLVAHPDVDMVTFTGSRAVGERIAVLAAGTIKRVALELGGKSAAIVLDDAPLEKSVTDVLRSCFANTGQTCAALTRVLVPWDRLPQWESLALEQAQSWRAGDPREESTTMGPLVSRQQRERVLAHIATAVGEGARLLTGGPAASSGLAVELSGGAYVEPTILTDVKPEMRVFRDEVFGPVLSIVGYQTQDEAVALANDSDYGLSGGVWSADPDRALSVALELRTGTVGINGAGLDVGAPFGGYKQSGIGRECGSRGFEEFLETKSVMGAGAS